MPRTKGSRNAKSAPAIENIDAKIAAVEAEIEELGKNLKAKKNELKQLAREKKAQIALEAAIKAEEDRKAILAAVEKSGKSVDEIPEFLK